MILVRIPTLMESVFHGVIVSIPKALIPASKHATQDKVQFHFRFQKCLITALLYKSHLITSIKLELRKGYNVEGDQCVDIDECSKIAGMLECTNAGSICNNLPGSYECICPDGFDLLNGSCVDIDECEISIHDCSFDADCINTSGSYECNCKPGFTKNGEYCDDINECEIGNACELLVNGKMNCENTPGSHTCTPSCNEGFKVVGNRCILDKPQGCEIDKMVIQQAMTKCWMRFFNVKGPLQRGRTKFRSCFKVKMTLKR